MEKPFSVMLSLLSESDGRMSVELPEAMILAKQMNEELKGREIAECTCGNSPHKWVFYNRPREEFGEIVPGRKVGDIVHFGGLLGSAPIMKIPKIAASDFIKRISGSYQNLFTEPAGKSTCFNLFNESHV